MIQKHNIAPAAAWGHSGEAWDFISFGLSDAISHAVQRLWPEPGERILDIGTGTGWAARLIAGLGVEAVGVDYSQGMIAAARRLSAHLADRLTFELAEAEALPFPDESFDGIVSTYGVIFSADPAGTAAEMARVLRPGGRMVLTTWATDPEGYIAGFFATLGRYADAPPPANSPLDWGDPRWLEETLGSGFLLDVEQRRTTLYAPDTETVWKKYLQGFGPMQLVAEALPPDRRAAFRKEFRALHAPFNTGKGLRIDRNALLVRGRRR